MNNRQILYSADLQKTGKSLKFGALAIIVAALIVFIGCMFAESFSGKLIILVFIVLFIVGSFIGFSEVSKWSNSPGVYQIYLDSIGFHIRSDDQNLGGTFSIAILNLHQLLRKHVRTGDAIEYEYYVVEKSGERHKINTTLANYNLDVMDIFEKVASQYPSVKIIEECA